jgi:hypothetical protein
VSLFRFSPDGGTLAETKTQTVKFTANTAGNVLLAFEPEE